MHRRRAGYARLATPILEKDGCRNYYALVQVLADDPFTANVAAIKTKTDTIASGSVTVVSPVATDEDITIYTWDDYDADPVPLAGLEQQQRRLGGTDLTTWTIKLHLYDELTETTTSITGSVVTATGTQVVRVELTHAQTGVLVAGNSYKYQVRAWT